MWTYFLISASAWGQARSKLGGVNASIFLHAFISIFIALWAVITHYVTILMAILSYFTRFIMKRENAGSWDSGWKRSKYWKPILHSSKNPETTRKSFLELIRTIERRKHQRCPPPGQEGGGRPPTGHAPCLLGPLVALRCPSSAIWRLLPCKNHKQAYGTKLHRHEAEPWRNQSRAPAELFCRGNFPPGGGNHHHRHHQRSSHREGSISINIFTSTISSQNPSSSLVSNHVSTPQIGTCGLLVVLITPCSWC